MSKIHAVLQNVLIRNYQSTTDSFIKLITEYKLKAVTVQLLDVRLNQFNQFKAEVGLYESICVLYRSYAL